MVRSQELLFDRERPRQEALTRWLVLQATTLHSPRDLVVAASLPPEARDWFETLLAPGTEDVAVPGDAEIPSLALRARAMNAAGFTALAEPWLLWHSPDYQRQLIDAVRAQAGGRRGHPHVPPRRHQCADRPADAEGVGERVAERQVRQVAQDLGLGRYGHYGRGSDAQRLLPAPTEDGG